MKQQKIVSPLALTLVLGAGIEVIWGMIVMVTVENHERKQRSKQVNYSISVQTDGTPLVQKVKYGYPMGYETRLEYFSLDGRPVEKALSIVNGATLWRKAYPRQPGGPGWSDRISRFPMGQDPKEPEDASIWYFIHDGRENGGGYFVGYELVGNHRIGYLGTDGFSQDLPPRDSWFAMGWSEYKHQLSMLSHLYAINDLRSVRASPILIRSGDQILAVDLAERSVREIFRGASLIAVEKLTRRRTPTNDNKRKLQDLIALRMPSSISVVSWEGEVIGTYALPKSVQLGQEACFYVLPNGQALLVNSHPDRSAGKSMATLSWIDTDGNLLDEREVALGELPSMPSTGRESAVAAIALPAPGVMVPGIALLGAPSTERRRQPELSYAQAVRQGIAQVWPIQLGLVILAVILNWACVRRQKKYALPWTKTWAVFVFFFGVPGYFAYLCHRRWPVREECTECHKQAPRDRDACTFCDTPFPDPAPKGIEVLA